ncbi:MAG: hypothetical protein EAZ74_06830 [Alphaproteobacteria bacterium]|nr:MAG: hypothetical protein EAZ74_06830 [Alphaproteobacteria bacterium]
MNMIISISQNSFSYNVVALLFLAWGGAGAAGWCFFIAALRAYIKQQPWKGWYYVLGLWGLLGVLPFLWFFLKMFLRIILFSKVDFDEAGSASGFFLLLLLILMSILPIYALFIAWYYRPRASL